MDESTDVDRMLARLGETTIRYREFSDLTARPVRPFVPVEPLIVTDVAPVPVGSWNAGRPVGSRLATEELIADPEAPGGRSNAIHMAELRHEPTLDDAADGSTPPRSLSANPERSLPAAEPFHGHAAATQPVVHAALTPAYQTPVSPLAASSIGPSAAISSAAGQIAAPESGPTPQAATSGSLNTLFQRVSGNTAPPPVPGSAPLSSLFKRLS